MGQCFGAGNKRIVVDGHEFNVDKLVGEGGFSFVYLGKDAQSGRQVAIKRITLHDDSVKRLAQREVKNHQRFPNTPHLTALIASGSAPSLKTAGGEDLILVFPFYPMGSAQDRCDARRPDGPQGYLSQEQCLREFLQVCKGVKALHNYTQEPRSGQPGQSSASQRTPLAHRDIKPANIMYTAEGSPVLMDFGSMALARFSVQNRSQALKLQDIAAEHCSMPYRPPEFFDPSAPADFDERTDIWSLGGLLYCMAFNESPFERMINRFGGDLHLAVANGNYRWPEEAAKEEYGPGFRRIVDSCLALELKERPYVDDIIAIVETELGDMN
eukprot:Clim_evm10s142 gene=Clim_evmTU10s142